MNKEKFVELATQAFPEAEITETTVNKGYGTREGITVRINGARISPTVYPETFPEDFGVDDIKDVIEKAYENAPVVDPESIIPDFEDADLRMKVCPLDSPLNEANGGVGKTLLDMTAVPYLKLKVMGDSASITITPAILDMWDKTIDEVVEKATANTVQNANVAGMNDVMAEMMFGAESSAVGINELNSLPNDMMYVISNEEKIQAAGAITSPEFLSAIREQVGNYYILPSSIHELLVVPVTDRGAEELQAMVQDVNDTQVSPEDRLTYSVYRYTEAGLEIAATA